MTFHCLGPAVLNGPTNRNEAKKMREEEKEVVMLGTGPEPNLHKARTKFVASQARGAEPPVTSRALHESRVETIASIHASVRRC